ncbi:unnamed protein product [Cryptosporidium hominis]|uniref:Uncharacterized protein n=1 Tax=Cryptosporidium hominis TaxID=237895 RepID=A0A0S4TCC2_CRYHO|nr:hypothetical protein [Cryptosporidium hominis TU502]PPS92959.1 Uncharacterized protein GY17_00003834 [Cryptosporidium hominis]CUV04859.1 unnamed protein product [Cryptosporidium hominis]|eukprot:PPS92959.1 Uncharacterized protein GY17_00003834 [Cryptosporidium hominis]
MSNKKTSTIICGFKKKNLEAIKTCLETHLNRENILDNAVIQECFNKDVLGFSLDSVSNLQELKEVWYSLFGKDPNTNRKELMHAISLSAGMSEVLNLSIYTQYGNEMNLGIFQSNEEKKLNEEESMNVLVDTSKLILEFLENGCEKDIYIKPIFKAERTTLILRDLENDVIENEIFDLLSKCPHFHTGETSSENKTNEYSLDAVKKLVVNFRKEIHGTWFITLKTEDLTTKVALWLRDQKLRDNNSSLLRVGIKSEHPIASLLSVLSMNKGIQSIHNRMSNLQLSGTEMGIGIPPILSTLNAPLSNLPPNVSSSELINVSAGNGPNNAVLDGPSSNRRTALGNVSSKMGYMVNIPGSSNSGLIQTHPQINRPNQENDQSTKDTGNEPQIGMDNLNSQNPEHLTAPLPVMYPYHRGIGRAIGVPNHTTPLNVYGPIPGAPNGGIIAPIIVVPGATIPGGVATSPLSSPTPEVGSPNASKTGDTEATKSPKNNRKRRGSKSSYISDSDTKSLSPNISNRRNSPDATNNVKTASEIENCGALPVADGMNSVIRGIPQGATTMIHGITPFYYGISGLSEVQPVNLQYLGGGPHLGPHPHIFIHGNPQFHYHHQIEIGAPGAAVQGDSGDMESSPPNTISNSETNKDNIQYIKPQMPPMFPAGYYHNVHYIGDESLGAIGNHGFSADSFAINNIGGSGIVVPGNLNAQARSFWVRNPSNSTGNQKFKANGRKNNNSSGNRTGNKSGHSPSNPKKNNNQKSSFVNGTNPEGTYSEPKVGSKIASISKSPVNDAITKHDEIDQYENAEMCSTNSSKQYPSNEREEIECSPSEEAHIGDNSSITKNTANTCSSYANDDNQNQISKKLPNESSTLPIDEPQDKQQTFNKTFKPFLNSAGKSRGHRNSKNSSNGGGNSEGKGNLEYSEYRSNLANDKSKVPDGTKGNNGPNNQAAETGSNYHQRRRASRQINTGGGGGFGGRENEKFTHGKYNGYENNHFRLKRTTENEQSHFNFNNHGKKSDGYSNNNHFHGNKSTNHKGKGNAAKSNYQESKEIGLDHFPSLSDAMATKK